MKLKALFLLSGLFAMILVLNISCNTESQGFVLPEGNEDAGKRSFVELNCTQCHSIGGIEWAGDEAHNDPHIILGGEVTNIKSYGELVTSVINPSHKIARKYRDQGMTTEGTSRMMVYNEFMTVQDLVDLVTFLQKEYNVVPPPNPYFY